jgi:hypothetical protein
MPDGWFINTDNELFIIENKCSRLQFDQAKKQLIRYRDKVIENNDFDEIYLVFAYGAGGLMRYKIYDSDMKLLSLKLEDMNLESNLLKDLNSDETELVYDIAYEFEKSKKAKILLRELKNLVTPREVIQISKGRFVHDTNLSLQERKKKF